MTGGAAVEQVLASTGRSRSRQRHTAQRRESARRLRVPRRVADASGRRARRPRSEADPRAVMSSADARGGPIVTLEAPPRPSEPRPFVSRPLLGLGVVLLTIIPAYVTSRVTAAHETSHAIYALSDSREESGPGIDSHIREMATRYGVPENLVVAIIEVESEFDPWA